MLIYESTDVELTLYGTLTGKILFETETIQQLQRKSAFQRLFATIVVRQRSATVGLMLAFREAARRRLLRLSVVQIK